MKRQPRNPLLRHSAPAFYCRLGWRNLWRNKKRTLIASASVFFAVFLAVAMSSLQTGTHDYMIEAAVGFYTGHIQVHGRNYWEKRSLDESMVLDPGFVPRIERIRHVTRVVPRLESVALISHGNVTKVSPVIGIEPVREDAMTGLGRRLVDGVTLSQWKSGALAAEGLARMLHARVGDSIVIYGQGYQGVTAAAIMPIAGIVKFAVPDLNNAMVYVPLSEAQNLYSAPGRVTSLAILLDRDKELENAAASVRAMTDSTKEVMTWREMMPELLQAIAADDGATIIMLLILYVVIGFGIFGTVMMMTAERLREFGMTIALGMKRRRLMAVAIIEALVVSIMGAFAGILVSIPVVVYFHRFPVRLGGDYAKAMLAYGMEPLLQVSLDPIVFYGQALVVLALGLISGLYPVLVLRSLEPVRAMRGQKL